MDNKKVGEYWDENAENWTKLARMGYDRSRDLINSPAMEKIIIHVKTKLNAKELLTYTLPQDRNAIGFYKHLGFKPTGKKLADGDLELRLELE